MTKQHQDSQEEPFFITEDVEAEMIATGYEFRSDSNCWSAAAQGGVVCSIADDIAVHQIDGAIASG